MQAEMIVFSAGPGLLVLLLFLLAATMAPRWQARFLPLEPGAAARQRQHGPGALQDV